MSDVRQLSSFKRSMIGEMSHYIFKFLGFSFRWQQSKKGTPYVHTEPGPGALDPLGVKNVSVGVVASDLLG